MDTAEWFDDRFYKIKLDQQEFVIPSVTTKLSIESKPFLYRYYAELGWDQAKRKLHESQDRGVRIHYAMYILLLGGSVIYNNWKVPRYSESDIDKIRKDSDGHIMVLGDQDDMVSVWKIKQFLDIVKPEILHREHTVYSVEDGIAGTLDAAFKIKAGSYPVNGVKGLEIPETGVYVFDLKTGNQVGDEAWAQLAAYCKGYNAMGYGKPAGAIIGHTSAKVRKGIEGFSATLKTTDELKPHYETFQHLSAVWNFRNPNAGPRAFEFPTLIKGNLETQT